MITSRSRYRVYQAVISFGLLWYIQADSITPDPATSIYEVSSNYFVDVPYFSTESSIYLSPSLDLVDVQKTILPSQILSELQATTATPTLTFLPSSSTTLSSSSLADILSSPGDTASPSVPETHTVFYTSSSETFSNHSETSLLQPISSSEESFRRNGISMFVPESSGRFVPPPSSEERGESSATSATFADANFHTPLMSLLAASSFSHPAAVATTSVHFPGHTAAHNESDPPEAPEEQHKKLLMLVLRAEDCTRLSKADFEKMLGKLMAKFGFGDAVPEVSGAQCYSHLNINLTLGHASPTLRFLPDLRNNITVDVLNRTFRIVRLEKIDLRFEKSHHSDTNTSHVIRKVARHESVAYVAVGVSFGLVLVLCVAVCCVKCCCLRKSQKRFLPVGTHMRLRPEDYTLTPIPRPTSLYADYYRGSVTADIYSTTSGGSIASTTPTVDQGIVQPFDTSIVPLEDSAGRDPSVESVPSQSTMKTFNLHTFSGKRMSSTDSKEQLNPKHNKMEGNPAGVANPTFQRY